MTSECKYCGAEIAWSKQEDENDERGFRWVPLDPDTDERHDCSTEEEEEEFDNTLRCRYCDEPIIFKAVQISKKNPQTGELETIDKRLPFDASQPSISHDCPERKEAWLAEISNRKGRSEAQLCKNGCGTLIYWNYDERSKKHKMPLPYEQASNAYHKCANYNPQRRR